MRTSFVSQQFGLFFSIVWLSTDERKLGPLGFVIEPGTPHETAKAAKVLELPKLLTVPTDSPREIGDFDLYEFMLNILKSPKTPKTPVLSILSMFLLRSEFCIFPGAGAASGTPADGSFECDGPAAASRSNRAAAYRQGVPPRGSGIPAAKKSSPPSDLCARPSPPMLFLRPRESHEGSYPVSNDPASLLAARVRQCGDGSGFETASASKGSARRTRTGG